MTITTEKKNDSPEEGGKREGEPTPRNTDWILKGLNDLREDLKELRADIRRLDDKIGGMNTRLWLTVGAVTVLTPLVIWMVVLMSRPANVPDINITLPPGVQERVESDE